MVQAVDDARPIRLRRPDDAPRVPPHNLLAEESLLGAMLLSADAISIASELLSAEDFYKPAHGQIFAAISRLYESGQPSDAVTVADELDRAGLSSIGVDPASLVALQANTPSSANATHYASIVQELAILRRLIGASGEIADLAYEAPDDVTAVIDSAEQMILDVAERKNTDSVRPLGELLHKSVDWIEERGKGHITGTATGFTEIDNLLLGLQPSSLTIVGARPSMGKTSFALGILTHVGAVLRRPALLFSLEMSHLELSQRLLASEARVDAQRMRTGQLSDADWSKVSSAITRLGDAAVFIDDNPHLTVMDVRARARRVKKQHGELGVVIVDYLQLMSSRARAENRQVEVAEMSRGLKILARELECPVVALSQLSRNLEQRADKRPMLSDLRESGSLEQDADVVLFLYREEAYDAEAPVEKRGLAEVLVSKHRNGPTGHANLAFIGKYARFDNLGQGI
ncbi:MAG TPA: replicative DNA helicase [Acidimicrobiales bacterium]|nr:replicative DNA helicase [Acidimicrobiales bacterium]